MNYIQKPINKKQISYMFGLSREQMKELENLGFIKKIKRYNYVYDIEKFSDENLNNINLNGRRRLEKTIAKYILMQ